MANYSRSRYYQLKEEYGYDYILLQDNYDKLWTYDNDAYALAFFLHVSVQKNTKGSAFLKFDEADLHYFLKEIAGEEGAFFLLKEDISLPSSALMKVILFSDYGERTIILVSDDKEQDTNNGIYWEGRGFAKAILHTVDTKAEAFIFKNIDYLIESVYYTESFEKHRILRYHFLNAEADPQIL